MRKLIVRLIGFAIFFVGCGAATVIVILFSTGTLEFRSMFPNLPEPPEIDTRGLPSLDEKVPELPDIGVPEGLQPGESVPLRALVVRRPIVGRIPAPQQMVRAPRVVGANAFLAIIMALLFGATSTVLGNMLRDEEPRIRAWLHYFYLDRPVAWIGKAFQWTLGGRVRQGCLTLPLIVIIIALYGIIFAFLEEGTSIFSQEGAFLAVGMAFSVGLVSFSGDIVRRFMARIWREKSRFNLYPINIAVAVGTVLMSRGLNLSPGIVFGTPGGADIDTPASADRAKRREVTLAFATSGMLMLLGGVAWVLSGVVLSLLDQPVEVRILNTLAALATSAQNTTLLVFLVALETLFFEMLPLAYGAGRTIFEWNKLAWAVVFVPIAFIFNHTLLNPQSGFLDSFLDPNVRLLWFALLLLVAVTAALWFYFNVLDDLLRDAMGIRLP